ncbi:MAG: hypothetical protein AAF281_00505 [Pseudomonadota bacterium]
MILRTAAIAALLATPVLAEGAFSEGSKAKGWGVAGEEKALFTGKVVDILCELTGDCPADCGAGDRQMGIVRDADNVLVLASKNSQPAFTGAARELAPFCGQTVEVDGNLVGDTDLTPAKFYQIQTIRPLDAEAVVKANTWTKVWAQLNPEAKEVKGPWFRKDPKINALIAESGYLGLGLETDAEFIDEWFE